ncbi:MAG: 50S ribosomal protein L18 [Candidatus Ranarchaeia archaeon]
MGHGLKYKVQFRRRREGKTHFYRRKKMIISGIPRLVVRKTNKNIIVQIADAKIKGDQIVYQAVSSELRKYSWNHGLNNIPAAYLTGLLIAQKVKKKKFERVITDFGLNTPNPESRVFAVVKGVVDGGLKVNCPESAFPSEDRIKGKHIADHYQLIKKEKKASMKNQYSNLVKNKIDPKEIVSNFEETKTNIEQIKVK